MGSFNLFGFGSERLHALGAQAAQVLISKKDCVPAESVKRMVVLHSCVQSI